MAVPLAKKALKVENVSFLCMILGFFSLGLGPSIKVAEMKSVIKVSETVYKVVLLQRSDSVCQCASLGTSVASHYHHAS